jgi:hypothetical protein
LEDLSYIVGFMDPARDKDLTKKLLECAIQEPIPKTQICLLDTFYNLCSMLRKEKYEGGKEQRGKNKTEK